jgi:Flp pilus assembly pilin Flp
LLGDSLMTKSLRTSKCAELLADRRGALSIEYLLITTVSLALAVLVAILGGTLVRSQQRAQAVLTSNTP